MAGALREKGVRTLSIDRKIEPSTKELSVSCIESDLDELTFERLQKYQPDRVLLLDILEHLRSPEKFLINLRTTYAKACPDVIVTTGNVGFIWLRLSLTLGMFNYGKRGILDEDHKRLFTFRSLRRLLESTGFAITDVQGIPVPFPLAFGDNRFSRFLLSVNRALIALLPSVFSYQIGIVVRPKATLEMLLTKVSTISPLPINESFTQPVLV